MRGVNRLGWRNDRADPLCAGRLDGFDQRDYLEGKSEDCARDVFFYFSGATPSAVRYKNSTCRSPARMAGSCRWCRSTSPTGALIAPFAFIGPEYDAEWTHVYTNIDQSDVYDKRFITAALMQNAMAETQLHSTLPFLDISMNA